MSFDGQWKRYGCCPFDADDIPSPFPNTLVFEIIGYNYRTIPLWFNSTGQKLIPSQFSVNDLKYRYTFYHPTHSKMDFRLSTSDDIVPIIYEKMSGKRMNVRRISRWNGYTTWSIS